ncbi:MAG: AAA family ATPase [Promethearchaeota archaeon]
MTRVLAKLSISDTKKVAEQVFKRVVGRKKEILLILSALLAGKPILLEGPPGVSKTTILRTLSDILEVPFYFVEGNEDLTASKLIGYFDPATVLQTGYIPENFREGALAQAMRNGGILYIEEINRAPPDALNSLVVALSERQIHIPRYGRLTAEEDFRIVAAMNPYDDIGVQRISRAILDRFTKLKLDYQNKEEEMEIVRVNTGSDNDLLIELGVDIGILTRIHPDLRLGASVRGAIDFVNVVMERQVFDQHLATEDLIDCACLTYSPKIWLSAISEKTEEEVIREIIQGILKKKEGELKEEFEKEEKTESPSEPSLSTSETETWGAEGDAIQQDIEEAIQNADTKTLLQFLLSKRSLKRMIGDDLSDVSTQSFNKIFNRPEAPELYSLLRKTLNRERELLARKLSTRIILSRAQMVAPFGAREGKYSASRFDGECQIDLPRTLEKFVENRPSFKTDDILVRKRKRVKRTYVLLLDSSESMYERKIGLAALAASVLAYSLFRKDDYYSIIAFHSRPFLVKPINQNLAVERVVNDVLTIEAGYLTNIAAALQMGVDETAKVKFTQREAFLLTDAVWTEGKDPRPIAQAGLFDRINILLAMDGDPEFAEELAYNGRVFPIDTWRDIVSAINKALAPNNYC